MASLRGERFDINLDQQNDDNNPEPQAGPPTASDDVGLVGDIKERVVTPSDAPPPPSVKNNTTGFPTHKDRINTNTSKLKSDQSIATAARPAILKNDEDLSPGSQPLSATAAPMDSSISFFEASDRERIDAENKKKIADMSPEQIEREQKELLAGLNPTLIEKLLKRSTIDDEPQPTSEAPPLERKSSQSPHRRRPSAGSVRKVSFAVEPEEEKKLTKRPTAERHSISSPNMSSLSTWTSSDTETLDEPEKSPTKHKRRPSPHSRKVSFAFPDSSSPQLDEDEPSAAKHSISPSPRAKSISASNSDIDDEIPLPPPAQPLNPLDVIPPPVNPMDNLQPLAPNAPDIEPASKSVHWHKSTEPTLDPNSATFLDDLHEKYFPTLAHDPSKLDWMKPSTSDSTYDPSAAGIAPSDVRFDFAGALVPPSVAATLPTHLGLHHHGAAPDAAGYTVGELARLARSAFPAQRCIAIQTLGRVLFRLGHGDFGDENDAGVAEPKEVGERAALARGLWQEVAEGRVLETLREEAAKQNGHRTSKALAEEALWNWQRGGGRQTKAV